MDKKRGPKPGFWIKYTIYECVLCGHTDEYREFIRDTPKPENKSEQYDYRQTGCENHFM